MTAEMSWKECVERGIITKSFPDKERSEQLLKMASLRLEFWNKKIEKKYDTLKVEAYYEIIKELLFAHIYRHGFNCTNHLCLIAYLEENVDDFDFEIQKIDELRKLRNEISYRGFNIRTDYLERNEIEFLNIISRLKGILKD